MLVRFFTTNLAGNSDITIPVTALPATGTFAKGTLLRNVSGSIGQPTGWVISTGGSFGSAGTISGTATAASNMIAVNDFGNLYPGCFILIAGTGGAPFVVQKLVMSGSVKKLYLRDPITNAVSGTAVTFVAPTATALSNL